MEKETPTTTALIEYGILLPVEVYYDDLDALGMLHHARYAMLFDRATVGHCGSRG